MKTKHITLFLIVVVAFFLRTYQLTQTPPSLYWDEVSLGYNAFSILKNGTDEHGNPWPITHFLAFGDAKPPLYIYATSLSMLIFGVGDFAVRFPSALAGTFAVAISYFLVHQLFSKHKQKTQLALISATLLAISPWHLQMSRVGYEANLALTLFLLGFWAFLKGLKQPKYWFITTISFIATLYTFNSYRIFLPLFLLAMGLIYVKKISTLFKFGITNIFLALVLVAPLIPFVMSDQAKLRFNEVTIFNNHQPVIQANQRIELNHNAIWAKVLHNRRILFAMDFLQHYTDHFKPDFLFFSGDVNPRLGIRDMGEMYYIELPLLLIGIYTLVQTKNKRKFIILAWILAGIVPAAVARETPHALRILQVLPVPQILVALGVLTLISKHKKILPLIIISYFLLFSHYLDLYYNHYATKWGLSWQYGYKPMVQYVGQIQNDYDRIYISNYLDRAYINTLFYLKFDPQTYLATRDSGGDAFGFTYTNSFDKFYFTQIDLSEKSNEETWLFVTSPDNIVPGSHQLHTIYDLKHQPVFVIQEI